MPLTAGTRLGHFEILNPIGAGGMGEVYRARDDRLGREVAIKILPEELATDEQALLRFQREAKSVAALSHPNIVALHELDRDSVSGVFFFASELLEGETLASRLRRGPIGWKKAAEIAASVADGLAAAHAKGIIHRDLKPANLFLTNDGAVKILDFGLARTFTKQDDDPETAQQVTKRGMMIGTVGYMSPEQIRGETLDASADLFSLSCILYEMVTGSHPFRGGTTAETIAAILKDDKQERLSPPQLDSIVQRCLEKRATQRFQSARDLAFDLRAILSGTPAEAFDSIAVLPFDNQSDPDTEYLSDGITETIISKLSQIPNLRVMARGTVFRYKKKNIDPQQVGAELNVRLLLHGRISHRGDALMIRTELVKVSDGTQLWGERYQRKSADLFEIEEEIAREISEKLRIRLSGDQNQLLARRYTADTEAYQAYLKGRYQWNKRSEAGLTSGVRWFQEALEKDPAYPLAHVGLADSYNLLGYYSLLPPADAFIKAEAAARRALELDDQLAEAYTSLGYADFYYRWEWDRAEKDFLRAIELKDAYSTAHHFYVNLLTARGRFEEALEENRRALELDPLSLIINAGRGWVHFFRRDYDVAIDAFRKAIALDETFGPSHVWLSWALVKTGQFPEAIAEAEKGVTFSGVKGDARAAQAYVHAAAGDTGRAEALLGDLVAASRERFIQPYFIAMTYAALGRPDDAFHWLRRSVELRAHYLVLLKVDPRMDVLRSRPEFAAIAAAVGV
jgi:serine/threonine protein kinase